MAKKMTEAMREWRDENMEAIREGVKAVKEGRVRPADEVFEELAQDDNDSLRAENARLQERVKELERHLEMDDPRLLTSVQLTATVRAERNRYKAESERRREALMEYGNHHASCILEHHAPGVRDCGCGYVGALRAAIDPEEERR